MSTRSPDTIDLKILKDEINPFPFKKKTGQLAARVRLTSHVGTPRFLAFDVFSHWTAKNRKL